MVLNNKTKLVLLAIAAITSLLIGNVFQVYAAPSQNVPTLVVFVHVINDDGGAMNASDFVVAVTAKDPSPSIFRGSERGTTVTMKNSVYKVTELEVKGYSVSYSPGCSGRINNNEAKTCVVTNDDIAPHLKVIKHVINDNEGTANASDFTMFVFGNNPSPSSFNGSENGTDVKIGPGFYFVNENFNPDYAQSFSPECSGQINLGENKTCTVTNDDIPKGHLTVIKQVINNDGGTANASDFTMFVFGNNPSPGAFPGSEAGTNVTINEGFYNVDESFNPQYNRSFSPDCSGFIRGGETKTCIITNDDVPPAHLIVVKHVINNNGGTANASDFTMFVFGNNPSPGAFPGSETGTNVTIAPGFYSVDESFNPQYNRFFSFDCSGFINPGETRTCTITNDDVPPIIVATLSGADEVPPTNSPATGSGTFVIDTNANTLSFNITFSGLLGTETAAHIHGPAPPGVNAGVLFPLPPGSPKVGVWNYLEEQEADILAGLTYVNIHSDVFPGGEIRGQIVRVG